MSQIPTKTLSNGIQIPQMGLGTYKEDKEEVLINAIKSTIKSGVRHFDCAYIYFNEWHIGKALRDAIQESNGALKREDFFITGKLWNTCHSKESVMPSMDACLKRFGFDYLDLYLIHWPMGFQENNGDYPMENDKMTPSPIHYTETYLAMEELVTLGKAKSIGISNFNIEQIKEILKVCKIRPVCNQFEVNPLWQNEELVKYCQSENIAVVAYAPLGAPDRGWRKTEDPIALENPLILDMAKRYNKSPAQVILRWLIQRDIIVIPKSVTPSRIEENSKIFDFELSADDMKVFRESFINQQFRFYVFDVADNHPFYPFRN